MKKLALSLLLSLLACAGARAQVPLGWPAPQGTGQVLPITASATGTTGAITATLTGVTGKYTYICGFVVTSAGTTTATLGNVTVTGTVTGTLNFEYAFVSSGQGLLGAALGPGCIISSALATDIVVSVPAGGAGTVVAVSVWGYTN